MEIPAYKPTLWPKMSSPAQDPTKSCCFTGIALARSRESKKVKETRVEVSPMGGVIGFKYKMEGITSGQECSSQAGHHSGQPTGNCTKMLREYAGSGGSGGQLYAIAAFTSMRGSLRPLQNSERSCD